MPLSRNEKVQTLAVGKNSGLLAGTTGSVRSEIPVETWLNDGMEFRITLRLIKRSSQFRNTKDIGYACCLNRIVGINEAGVIKRAPSDHTADSGISSYAAVGLCVSYCLYLLEAHIACAAILDRKTFSCGVVELSDCFGQHVRDTRNGVFDAYTAVGFGMIVVECKYIFLPILLPIFAGSRCHRSGVRTGIIEGFRQCGGTAVQRNIVCRFIRAHTPDDDRRMIPIAQYHLADIANQKFLPRLVTEITPAGNLFPYH